MTDDELRRALAEKLGWTDISKDGNYGHFPEYCGESTTRCSMPSLAQLVATVEARLTEEQQIEYGASVTNALTEHGIKCFGELAFRLITAPAAVRARALLEVLPETALTGDGGMG